ncbi:MAG: Uma2 family endonuclease [Planctomycetota bacterium]
MTAVIADFDLQRSLIRRRRLRQEDRYDEVWDGVYVMNAQPNNVHQSLVSRLTFVFESVIGQPGLGMVLPGTNVSDRAKNWKKNYRCPDVAVFLNGTKAINRETHWQGGPDLAVEIASPQDQTWEKIEFYASVGTRELIIVDRAPWAIELYRLSGSQLSLVGRTDIDSSTVLETESVPLRWRLVAGPERPLLEATVPDGSKSWLA